MITERQLRAVYVACDFAATNVAWFVFNLSRYNLLSSKLRFSLNGYLTSDVVVLGQILFPILMLCFYWLSGYYNLVYRKSRAEELVSTFTSTLAGSIVIFFLVLLNDMTDNLRLDYALFGILFGILFIFVYFTRWIITTIVVNRIHSGKWGFETIVIDCGADPARLNRYRSSIHTMGFRITDNIAVSEISDIDALIKRRNTKCLIVSPHPDGPESTLKIINRLLPTGCTIYVVPDEFQLLMSRTLTSDVTGDPLIDITRSEMPQSTLNFKRVADVALSFIALTVLSPLYLAIAIAVKLDSSGSVFYRQQRVGYRKRPFNIIKFRSMYPDAEKNGPQLSGGNHDNRITRVGHYLRKYRLDELPQFWNVLTGDMSLVGPRPEREFYETQIMERAPYYALLHSVRPGITSWGMVRYGYADNVAGMVERMHYDLLYLENISFAVDMKIILHTIITVFKGRGK